MMPFIRILTRESHSTAGSRRARFTVLLLLLLVSVGGSGAALAAPAERATAQLSGVHDDGTPRRPRPAVLPFGSGDPHAVTEAFLAQHEDAALSVQHLAILTLEPTYGFAGDTGTEEGIDEVRYHIKRKTRLNLRVHPLADQVGRVVLKDRRGRELARHERGTPPTSILLRPGVHVLEVHHASPGDPQAPTRTVFVRPFAAMSTDGPRGGAVAAIEVSQNCVGCDFSNTDLTGQDFSGLQLDRSVFSGATLTHVKFVGALMAGCDFHSRDFNHFTRLRATDFTRATLTNAKFDMVQGPFTDNGPGGIFVGATLDHTTWGPVQPDPNINAIRLGSPRGGPLFQRLAQERRLQRHGPGPGLLRWRNARRRGLQDDGHRSAEQPVSAAIRPHYLVRRLHIF